MDREQSAAFLANRPPEGAGETKAHVLSPAEAAKLRGGTTSSPDGKPHPGAAFDVSEKQFRAIAKFCAERAAAKIGPYIEGLKKQIAELKNGGGEDYALSHHDASGSLVAEFWERDGRVSLRVGGKATTSARARSARAKKLLEKFEDMAPI
jgi:hypothetical protein